MNLPKKRIPFTVDHAHWGSLIDQVADGLRKAITTGYYRAGELLPGLRELAVELGVSIRVPTQAMARLAQEGLVCARPRIGSIVLSRRKSTWRGHLLIVVPGGDYSYHSSAFNSAIRDSLAESDYLTTVVPIPRNSRHRYDYSMLDYALKSSADLVLLCSHEMCIAKRILRANMPFVMNKSNEIPPAGIPGLKGVLCHTWGRALVEFTETIKALGVGRVVVVEKWADEPKDISRALRSAGVSVSHWVVDPPQISENRLEMLQRHALSAMSSRLAKAVLPDMFVFTDDYVASAGLLALVHAGLSIPEDVHVVTIANRGFGPVFWKELTRFEIDPSAYGRQVASAILEYFTTGQFPSRVNLEQRFIIGET